MSVTNSRCIHFVLRQIKTHEYALEILHPLPCLSFILNGPAKSMPVEWNGGVIEVLSRGKLPIICRADSTRNLTHLTQFLTVFRVISLPLKDQNFSQTVLNSDFGPAWKSDKCSYWKIRFVKWCFGRTIVCLLSKSRSENSNLPLVSHYIHLKLEQDSTNCFSYGKWMVVSIHIDGHLLFE